MGGNPKVALAEINIQASQLEAPESIMDVIRLVKLIKKKLMLPCLHNPVIFHSYVLEFPRNIHNLKRTKKVNDD